MAPMLLQLSICLVIVIHLTSSQSTYDVIREDSDVTSCGRNEQALNQLVAFNSELMKAVSQLQKDVAHVSKDVAELKADRRQKDARDCPANFTYLPSVNGGCYKVVRENLDWNDAGLRCRSLHKDAHLLVINDAVEQSAVAGMLSSMDSATFSGCASAPYYGVLFWTAGQRVDPNSNSTFMWRVKSSDANVETLSVMKYTNWHPGQPDFYQNYHQSCMRLQSGLSYGWDDVVCSTATCSVCELDI